MTTQAGATIRLHVKIARLTQGCRHTHGRITREITRIRNVTRRSVVRAPIVRDRITLIRQSTFVGTFRLDALGRRFESVLQITIDGRALVRARQHVQSAILEAILARKTRRHFSTARRLNACVAVARKNDLAAIGFFDDDRRAIQIELTIIGEIGASGCPKEKPEHRSGSHGHGD